LYLLATATWFAVNVTVPNPTGVITPVLALIVATFVSLLAYVIDTSVLLLVGAVVIPNEISPTAPYVAELRTVNVDDESVGVPRATVSVVVIVPVA
jgi:hypothetical protein